MEKLRILTMGVPSHNIYLDTCHDCKKQIISYNMSDDKTIRFQHHCRCGCIRRGENLG